MTPHMGRVLGRFQHRVAILITGRQLKRQVDGVWYYLTLDTVMQEAGFKEMVEYVLKSQNVVAQYIAKRLILDLFKETTYVSSAMAELTYVIH